MPYATSDSTVRLKELSAELNEAVEAYQPSAGIDDFEGRVGIIEKAKKIAQMMMDPSEMSMHHVINMTELVAIRTLLKFRILQSIPYDGPVSLAELSKTTGVQDSLLERMLRLVVGTGFIGQTEAFEYEHSNFSRAYTTVPGPGNFFQAIYDTFMKSMYNFDDYLVARKSLREPDDLFFNPYTWHHNQDGTPVWEIMAQLPERLEAFQVGLSSQEASIPVVGLYDFGQLSTNDPERTILVDVGGGQGQSITQILQIHPTLSPSRMVLQDLPPLIAQARLSSILSQDVVKMEHDFFTPQPVKFARAYYLRRVMADYSDANCVKILTQLANVMASDSRILIADVIMPKRVSEADLAAAALDNVVLCMGGKQRTEEGLAKVLEESGLRLVKVWRAAAGAGAVVEARLR